jgi:aryl-alcohol dehydrogenase-like predicted oxidoreductase
MTNNPLFDSVIIGTWAIGGWMWGGTNKKDAIEAIQTSVENGINSIDTAPVYGFGVSEEIVGEAIKPYKNKVKIFTKFGLIWHKKTSNHYFSSKTNSGKDIDVYKHAGKDSIIYECEQSLKRLGIEAIELYQIHWPDITTNVDESMEALNILKDQGKIKYAGVSNYDKQLLSEALKTTNIVSNQIPFSIINRKTEKETIPFCKDNNVSILAYSPLQKGLLTGKFKPGHVFNSGDHREKDPFFSGEMIFKTNDFLNKIKNLAGLLNCSLAQLVLAYTLNIRGISSVIIGARNKKQALENVGCMDISLTNDQIDFISLALKESGF